MFFTHVVLDNLGRTQKIILTRKLFGDKFKLKNRLANHKIMKPHQ